MDLQLRALGPDMFRSLELMSGTAHYSTSLASTGLWHCHIIDYLYSSGHDLLSPVFQSLIISLIIRGAFDAVHIGLDCRSWTRLANPPYRSNQSLNGLPTLSNEKKYYVRQQNALKHFALRVIKTCKDCKVKVVEATLENGVTTMLWIHPDMEATMVDGEAIHVAYCRFGSKWKKNTKIWSLHGGLGALARKCQCSMPHEVIKGAKKVKGRWVSRSSLSASYPKRMCKVWAKLLTQKVIGNKRELKNHGVALILKHSKNH